MYKFDFPILTQNLLASKNALKYLVHARQLDQKAFGRQILFLSLASFVWITFSRPFQRAPEWLFGRWKLFLSFGDKRVARSVTVFPLPTPLQNVYTYVYHQLPGEKKEKHSFVFFSLTPSLSPSLYLNAQFLGLRAKRNVSEQKEPGTNEKKKMVTNAR